MLLQIHRDRDWRRWLLAALSLSLLLRALIPNGYMPASPAEDGWLVRLCSAGDVQYARIDPASGELVTGIDADSEDGSSHTHELCPYSLLLSAADLSAMPGMSLADTQTEHHSAGFDSELPASPTHFLPPARGPPALRI